MMTPMTVISAVTGITAYRPRMSSISRLAMCCSMLPTHRNKRALMMAWKINSKIPAVIACGEFNPAQANIRPRLLMVE